MHTMAAVKNAALAEGDTAEPAARVLGERQVVDAADMLVANTELEAKQLIDLYDADATRVEVVPPGVDLRVFRARRQEDVRARLGVPLDAVVPAFVGRLQPLKAPDVFLLAVANLVEREPALRHRLFVPVIGGPSGSGLERPGSLAALAERLGITDLVRFVPAVSRERLAEWYAAADLVCLPSYSESFGLVALEAQASGTPVVAAAVGGLTTVVRDGRTGCLVEGHDPEDYARAMATVLTRPGRRAELAAAAVEHALDFAWERTAVLTHDVYRRAAGAARAAAPHG
jgi:D-inositol-3-phosphate glycosyltransferase